MLATDLIVWCMTPRLTHADYMYIGDGTRLGADYQVIAVPAGDQVFQGGLWGRSFIPVR